MTSSAEPSISSWQTRRTRAVVAWYLEHHHNSPHNPGMPSMFCDPEQVGHFAVAAADLQRGAPKALFRVLVASAMFQRRQDVQILRILRGLTKRRVSELTSSRGLLLRVARSSCEHLKSLEALKGECDLGKCPETRRGTCARQPATPCHMKDHTEWLKRYGHFGKVPTSLALMLREAGQRDLKGLWEDVVEWADSPLAAAIELEAQLSAAWRVNQKIASMFLSLVTNPDLYEEGDAPWSAGVDWTYYVVIDSNVDLYLEAIGYSGPWTYDARRGFLRSLAKRIDLTAFRPTLQDYNPRIVQQALYMFMSTTNRRASPVDCAHEAPSTCVTCPSTLRSICPAGPGRS